MPAFNLDLNPKFLTFLFEKAGFMKNGQPVKDSDIETALTAHRVPPQEVASFMGRLKISPLAGFVQWDKKRFFPTAAGTTVDELVDLVENSPDLQKAPWFSDLSNYMRKFGINGALAMQGIVAEVASQLIDLGALFLAQSQEAILNTPYVNTITPAAEEAYPEGMEADQALENAVRWNAAMMVDRANRLHPGLGGHLSTFQSAAVLYEVLFNHFLDAEDAIYVQGHSAPGIYARAFIEGRLSQSEIEHFRREVDGLGLPSYPHPLRRPDFWTNATVSMGLGPIGAIMQARFNRYLEHRGLLDTSEKKVFAFLGDGEMDEPEAKGALTVASREKLDNLVFVINCNLQRLDSPVRPNGSIIQELEASFKGSGWNVIKVVWGSRWDPLFAKDAKGALLKRVSEISDGEWQNYGAWETAKVREAFIGDNEDLRALFEGLSDDEFREIIDDRGGHDPRKVYAAYQEALKATGKPTVILAQTIKGRDLGGTQAALGAHNTKLLDPKDVAHLANRLQIPVEVPADEEGLKSWNPFYRPAEVVEHAQARREALGGTYFNGLKTADVKLSVDEGYLVDKLADRMAKEMPKDTASFVSRLLYALEHGSLPEGAKGQPRSTTMAYLSLMQGLLSHPKVKDRIVPIIPDEGRTFGWDALFQSAGVYDPLGQTFGDRNAKSLVNYRTRPNGQVLQEGINEAGAMATFIAAATSAGVHGHAMVPFYIFYSMFGLQRTMDQWWQNADMRGRGFLIGATYGRTTLNGEGTQHQDGHSLLLASTIPNLKAYDPAFAYEMAMIVEEGLREMYDEGRDVFYYLTAQNENYLHPDLPQDAAERTRIREGVIKGMYRFHSNAPQGEDSAAVDLFASGSLMPESLKAQALLKDKYGITSNVWSVTSYSELAREAAENRRLNHLKPEEEARVSYLEKQVAHERPIVAVSDSVRGVADQIRSWVKGERFHVLGTDGFGLSDTRPKLRDHFEVSAKYIAYQALLGLHKKGEYSLEDLIRARDDLGLDTAKPTPTQVLPARRLRHAATGAVVRRRVARAFAPGQSNPGFRGAATGQALLAGALAAGTGAGQGGVPGGLPVVVN